MTVSVEHKMRDEKRKKRTSSSKLEEIGEIDEGAARVLPRIQYSEKRDSTREIQKPT